MCHTRLGWDSTNFLSFRLGKSFPRLSYFSSYCFFFLLFFRVNFLFVFVTISFRFAPFPWLYCFSFTFYYTWFFRSFPFFFGRFLFSPFSMSFCLTFRLALTCSSFLIFFFCFFVVFFWKQKVKVSDAICLESFRHILLFYLFFFFCPAEFELRLWLALKVLYELRISFNSLAGTSSSHEVVGCIISAFPLPIFHFHLAVSFL